ncbi:hypothetical protein [Aurantimonas sp. A3-2-R12]|uniref:hypothetical protein n=1 Tax=Aurantimonas sp. A3-2-R12 TaxID=3114362 RepID=UPI002E17E4D0|nr:hypothetical protein [Aurantimonas sp. A3-2-R12]
MPIIDEIRKRLAKAETRGADIAEIRSGLHARVLIKADACEIAGVYASSDKPTPGKICGVPLVFDAKMPVDEIWFMRDREAVDKITAEDTR